MDKMKYFKQAAIAVEDGTLIVNTLYQGIHNSHTNVTVRQNCPGEYVVGGFKRRFKLIHPEDDRTSPEALDQFTDESIDTAMIRSWPWQKKREVRYLPTYQYAEYKEQKKVTYTTTELIVIE